MAEQAVLASVDDEHWDANVELGAEDDRVVREFELRDRSLRRRITGDDARIDVGTRRVEQSPLRAWQRRRVARVEQRSLELRVEQRRVDTAFDVEWCGHLTHVVRHPGEQQCINVLEPGRLDEAGHAAVGMSDENDLPERDVCTSRRCHRPGPQCLDDVVDGLRIRVDVDEGAERMAALSGADAVDRGGGVAGLCRGVLPRVLVALGIGRIGDVPVAVVVGDAMHEQLHGLRHRTTSR